MEKYLSDAEILKLELEQKKQLISKLEKLLLEKDSAIIKHQKEELKLKIGLLDAENFKLQQKIVKKSESLQKLMEQARDLHKRIEEKYEIEPGWGFDTETNQLILKED